MKNSIFIMGRYVIKYIIRIILITVIMLSAQDLRAGDIFGSLSGRPMVECSYISGRFANNKKVWSSFNGMHSFDLSRGFSALYSYQCYSEEDVKDARKILNDYLKKNKDMELVMKTVHGGMEYMVYEKFGKDNLLMQMIVWTIDSPNVCEVVVIDWDKGLPRRSEKGS